jgi:hypothetical protein
MKPVICMLMALVLLGAAFAKERPVENGTLVAILLLDTSHYYVEGEDKIYYTYQITARVGCTEYTGKYISEESGLAVAYMPGDTLEVRVTRQRWYARAPGEEKFMEIRHSSQRSIDKCKVSESGAQVSPVQGALPSPVFTSQVHHNFTACVFSPHWMLAE